MIEVKNLSKEFKKPVREEGVIGMFKTLFSRKYTVKKAVDNITFSIKQGEIVGYIGSNGAGKSTTIKMMCGILTPTNGSVYIDGDEPYLKRKKVAQKIGVVFGQKSQLWWDIPLKESFKVLKEMYLINDNDYNDRMEFLCDTLGIREFINQPVRTLSLGQRMRADLAASWLHNPKVLFLDEPTIGLDVFVKDKIRDAIKIMNEKYNTTVVLTTHDMEDIENLCSRVILIESGKIIFDGPLENIKYRFGDLRTISINLKEDIDVNYLDSFNERIEYQKDNDTLIVKFNALNIDLEEVMTYLLKNVKVNDIKINEIGIEDVVKNIYSDEEKRRNTNA